MKERVRIRQQREGGREWREGEEGRRGNIWLIKESHVDFVTGGE